MLKPGEFRPGSDRMKVLATDSDDAFSLGVSRYRAGQTTPLHIHHHEAEYVLLTEGEMVAEVGGVTFEMTAGCFVHLPKGVPHRLTFPTDGRGIAVYSPGSNIEAWGRIARELQMQGKTFAETLRLLPPQYGMELISE
jgi:quercetin dioxygenase-like cupin family protein